MTREHAGTTVQPTLADLMARYLRRQADAPAFTEPAGDVVPHEATPVQPVNAEVAWRDGLTALPAAAVEAPPAWPALVAALEPATAVAMCAANYPQQVRSLLPLLRAGDPAALRPAGGRPVNVAG